MTLSIIKRQSPNFDTRRNGNKIKFLILHYTGTQSAEEAERVYLGGDPHLKVSPHYMIEEDGKVTQFVEEDRRAWHAGKSFWQGDTDINSSSIGIELVNPGHAFGYRDFSSLQLESLKLLAGEIINRHDIEPRDVLAHSDVSPERREDPGERFPWQDFAKRGIGVWPEECSEVSAKVADGFDFYVALLEFGYDPSASQEAVITAFQRHFVPESFESGSAGSPCSLSISRLQFLMDL